VRTAAAAAAEDTDSAVEEGAQLGTCRDGVDEREGGGSSVPLLGPAAGQLIVKVEEPTGAVRSDDMGKDTADREGHRSEEGFRRLGCTCRPWSQWRGYKDSATVAAAEEAARVERELCPMLASGPPARSRL
jgi:hypothetical protein